ncbi:MAG: DnaJ like chaperone protein [Candidatus Magnetoglobus multicellularis str. Araruama]|uniref:DnaJ like chaperone protein n=1 Tax=Candidatus Magnetoglobus multicellularis str. Araruama TaxID=890399 RepID=A0A1V1NSI9_9BACT|nr:MAG: DnaJ like chaperone protein [Candidatus Magnetoglobus multicellularis str. Araruama]
MIAKLAMADGDFSEDERHVIENLMKEELHLGADDVEMAVSIFNNALLDTTPFDFYASTFYQDFQSEPQLLELMLEILLKVSYADGVLNKNEETMLLSATKIFKFSKEEYESIKSRYDTVTGTNNKYYAILGCSPDDPVEIIKKCYRNMIVEYHPDKISSKGLPEEFILFANEKFKEIQNAYEIIKKERNIR